MSRTKAKRNAGHERVIVTLPKPLVTQIRQFASAFRGGNKSGFVADAIASHIDRLGRARHTARLREAYAAAARRDRGIAKEWEHVDNEAWEMLDEIQAETAISKKK